MTTWRAPIRSPQARAIYAAAEADRQQKPDRYRLDAPALVARALEARAEDELGPDDWSEGLEVFLESARSDADLNAVGLRMAAAAAVGRLRARIAARDYAAQHPEQLDRAPVAPIFITGGWRTGTTFLQRMLARDPQLRALHPWELALPWKARRAVGEERERLIAESQAVHDRLHLLNPRLQLVHDSGADLPEECVLAMGMDFRNWGFLSTMRLARYADWLAGQDFARSYVAYRKVLRMLDAGDGRRFLLKAPAHSAELPSLLAAFPDAVVVQLHRDVVETVASGASLFAVFRSTYSDAVDAVDVGAFQARQTALWFERAVSFRNRCDAGGRGCFVDVAYRDLVRDPIAVARSIYGAADLEWSGQVEHTLRAHAESNAQHGHGKHRYSPEEFGLDPAELRERFSAYRERFGVD